MRIPIKENAVHVRRRRYAQIVTVERDSFILRWLLLSGVFVGVGFNIKMAEAYLVLPAFALTYLLCAPLPLRTRTRHLLRAAGLIVGAGLLALLIAPAVWSGYTAVCNIEGAFPTAGPPASSGKGSASGIGAGCSTSSANKGLDGSPLIAYLEAHQGNAKFLVATIGSVTAAPIILITNKPVMTLGGYSGNDPILTTGELQSLVYKGTVRFFLVNPSVVAQGQAIAHHTRLTVSPTQHYSATTLALSGWIGDHCIAVQGNRRRSSSFRQGSDQLYDCAIPHR